MLKSFSSIIEQMKINPTILSVLVEEYKLNVEEPLTLQLENKLERKLTTDEAQTIEYAEKHNKTSGHKLTTKPKNRTSYNRWGKKKKKK